MGIDGNMMLSGRGHIGCCGNPIESIVSGLLQTRWDRTSCIVEIPQQRPALIGPGHPAWGMAR